MQHNDISITGFGIVSPMGSSITELQNALSVGSVPTTMQTSSCGRDEYHYYESQNYDLERFSVKKSDKRTMSKVMLDSAYAAGCALEGAGLIEELELKSQTSIYTSAHVIDRDDSVDQIIEEHFRESETYPDRKVIETLYGLRPTMFLAQLPNLLSASISMIHSVKGRSITFLGEASSGVSCLESAIRAINSGAVDRVLVGGGSVCSSELELSAYHDVSGGNSFRGNASAFLVVERSDVAAKRGAKIVATVRELEHCILEQEQNDDLISIEDAQSNMTHVNFGGVEFAQSSNSVQLEKMCGDIADATIFVSVVIGLIANQQNLQSFQSVSEGQALGAASRRAFMVAGKPSHNSLTKLTLGVM